MPTHTFLDIDSFGEIYFLLYKLQEFEYIIGNGNRKNIWMGIIKKDEAGSLLALDMGSSHREEGITYDG